MGGKRQKEKLVKGGRRTRRMKEDAKGRRVGL